MPSRSRAAVRGMMLVDSNVLVYAINSASPKHTRAQQFIEENQTKLCVAHQNILETLRVLTHPKFANPMVPVEALAAVTAITDHLRIITPDITALYTSLELMKIDGARGNRLFDAYLAATALAADVMTLATDNVKDFAQLGIDVVNPFA